VKLSFNHDKLILCHQQAALFPVSQNGDLQQQLEKQGVAGMVHPPASHHSLCDPDPAAVCPDGPKLTISVMDLLDFIWPAWVYQLEGAPLHAAYKMKEWYIGKYNDPIVQWTPETASGHDSWMGLFMQLEFAFLLPTVVYGIYRLGVQRRGTSGADELLFLVYAIEVALTTLICIFDVSFWDAAVYSAELKRELQVQLYGPWCLVRKSLPCVTALGIFPSDHHQQPLLASIWRGGFWAASGPPTLPWRPGSPSRGFIRRSLTGTSGEMLSGVMSSSVDGSRKCINIISMPNPDSKTPWYLL
jgi:hypothetical protein